MSVDDREDFVEATVIKGKYGTELYTVMLDSNHNIIAVMKGVYSGSLHTIALDSAHRMIGRFLPSIEMIVVDRKTKAAVATDDSLNSDAVPAGKYWRITNITAWNETSLSARVLFMYAHSGTLYRVKTLIDVPPRVSIQWDGEVWLDETDYVLIGWEGIQIDDSLRFDYQGTQISKV